jgi:hypothetical protein
MRYGVSSERLVWILANLNQYALGRDAQAKESTLNSEFLVFFVIKII